MQLTPADRRYLIAASEVMLRPFEHPTPLKYLVAVSEQLRPLIGAFASMCGTRDPDGVIGLDSAQWSAEVRGEYARWKFRDEGTNRALQVGSDVLTMRRVVGNDWEAFNRDPMVNEWYRPHGIHDVASYMLHWTEDDALATIELHCAEFGTPRFGEEGECLLMLLQPAFRAGMRLLYSVGQLRETIARDMDALGVPLCVCSREGRIHHMSAAVRQLLAVDPESARVIDRIPDVAAEVAVPGRPKSSGRGLPSSAAHQVVTTATRRYRLSAALATHSMQFGRTDVFVSVSALTRESSLDGDLSTRYGLSARERQVALLLGQGLSNKQVAKALGLSIHTCKRHTERVLAKLGVRTRAAVAAIVAMLPV